MKLSIIIPIFNEEKTIKEVLKRVASVRLPFIEKEVVIVDDASTDGSKLIIQKSGIKGLKIIFHQKNMGKGRAIRTGIKQATGEVIIIQDADLEYNPDDYSKLLRPIIENKAKVVFGSRLMDYPLRFWGKDKTILPYHLIANKFLTFLTNLLYGSHLTDMETGYKLFKSDLLKKISITSNRFEFEPEITVKILKLKIPITEIPIKVKPRTYQEGKKISWRDGILAVWELVKYKFVD